MYKQIIQSITLLIIFQMIFPPTVFAAATKSKTIVVVPIRDNISDNISNDLSDSFTKVLLSQGVQVVPKDKVESVMSYYQRAKEKNENGANEYEDALIRGKEHYFNFEYAEAMAQVNRAIALMEAEPKNISEHGSLLRDAYVTAGIVEKSEKNRDEAALGYFKKALEIDPQYELDEKAFAPSVVSCFAEARSQMSGRPVGSISVETDPKVAEVYVNGVLKGVTPIVVSGLPEKNYNLAIKTNKYKPFEKELAVKANETIKIKEKLYWSSAEEKKIPEIHNILTSPNEAKEQIAEGVRIAELLRVPKVVFIDTDEMAGGGGEIAIRMIDRKYRAGHNPIFISYNKNKKLLQQHLTDAANVLLQQVNVALLDNPTKNLDPDGIGDPVLLGKRGKKALLAIPAFWGIVGGILAAGAGGGIAAAALSGGGGGGGNSGTGSVNVQFK